MKDYWTPLATVTDSELDEYLETLEHTIEERLDNIPDYQGLEANSTAMIDSTERAIYTDLLENLSDFRSKNDIFLYADEQIQTEDTLPAPLNTVMRPVDWLIEGQRKLVFRELFQEAKKELREETRV